MNESRFFCPLYCHTRGISVLICDFVCTTLDSSVRWICHFNSRGIVKYFTILTILNGGGATQVRETGSEGRNNDENLWAIENSGVVGPS